MPNSLINEQSPYLQQHAHNPVNWYAWGDEPFEVAKKEQKPVLVSIGYAACHWCHVMERESFENPDVAAYMNEHFINIKVDREEHPDVDHLYMDAVQAISGSGGWPLNVFVTPERLPFYGGTYFPPRPAYSRPSWPQLLQRMHEIWTDKQDEVAGQTEQMLQYLQQASKIAYSKPAEDWNREMSDKTADNLLAYADKELGGFGRAPKFPGTMSIRYLLEHYHYTGHEPSLKQALLSLDGMINGGIYDQLGGGLARYSTDDKWLAPHFEKMLYDNALFLLALCDAYSITKNERYKKVIEQTIAFAERELKEPSGGYYSAIDADSEGVEGKFYTWTWDEWVSALGENDDLTTEYYGVRKEGNWEHTNILHITKYIAAIAIGKGMDADVITAHIESAKTKLWNVREQRIRPITDDKSLLSWNALMNLALSQAGAVLNNDAFKARAIGHMEWMAGNYRQKAGLFHTWKQGVARITANIDDYAYLIQAMLQLASVTGKNEWIIEANTLINEAIEQYRDEAGNFFYFTSVLQKDIPVRKMDIYDGATPSANAVMAHNLLLAGICMERTDFTEQALFMLQQMSQSTLRHPSSFSYWGLLLQRYAHGFKTLAGIGEGIDKEHQELLYYFNPHVYVITSKKEISELPLLAGKQLSSALSLYICTMDACLPPVPDAASALSLLNQLK